MITADKIKPDMTAYWFALMLILVILVLFGRQPIEWILMKLYQFFVQKNTMQ